MDTILRDYTDALPAPALAALGLTPPRSRFDTVLMGWNTYAVGLTQGLDKQLPASSAVCIFPDAHRRPCRDHHQFD